jgi:hypothetical protein
VPTEWEGVLTEQEGLPTVYTVYLFTYGGGGGEFNQREGYRGNSSQSWVENTNMIDCISSL